MYRFLLYSLLLHVLIVAIVFVATLFTSKPENIKIQLAVLPKNSNVKEPTSSPKEIPKLEEKKETPEEAQKKTEAVQKLLDSVLKEDIQEKAIEKKVIPKEIPKEIKSEPIKEVPKILPKYNAVQKEIPQKESFQKKEVTPEEQPVPSSKVLENKSQPQKQDIMPLPAKNDAPKVQEQAITKIPSPYDAPVMPKENLVQIPQPQNNPYANPIIPNESIQNQAIQLEQTPSLQAVKPKRKEIDFSKDSDVGVEANSITKDSSGISNNIMSNEAFYLSSDDKKALMNQMSVCLASLGIVRENTESVTLLIEMQEDAKIKNINVIKNNKVVPKKELSNLETRVIYLFNNPKCAKLILPKGKFSYWQKFTIKLNLKGLFE